MPVGEHDHILTCFNTNSEMLFNKLTDLSLRIKKITKIIIIDVIGIVETKDRNSRKTSQSAHYVTAYQDSLGPIWLVF